MLINQKSYEDERVKLLMKKNLSTLILAFISTILFFMVFKEDNSKLSLFLIVMPYNIFSLARHIVGKYFWDAEEKKEITDYSKWENTYAFLTLGAGLSFGFMNYWCFSTTEYLTQTFCIAMTLGFTSGAINTYSASMRTVTSYTLPSLLFLILAFIFKGGENVHYILSVMTFLFFLNGTRGSKNINEMINKQVQNKLNSIQTSKMGALGEMASGMAHEINNPLTIITGQIKYLEKVLDSDQFDKQIVKERLDRVASNVKRITQIITALRRYSSDTPEEVETNLKISEVIERALSFCEKRTKELSVEIKASLPNDEIMVTGRALEINQALVNIINNAIDAASKEEARWVNLDITPHKSKVLIAISNSGKKINDEIIEKMYMPFFTTKDIGEGKGLGLSTAKGIIEAHDGEIRYMTDSENTCFSISFPITNS